MRFSNFQNQIFRSWVVFILAVLLIAEAPLLTAFSFSRFEGDSKMESGGPDSNTMSEPELIAEICGAWADAKVLEQKKFKAFESIWLKKMNRWNLSLMEVEGKILESNWRLQNNEWGIAKLKEMYTLALLAKDTARMNSIEVEFNDHIRVSNGLRSWVEALQRGLIEGRAERDAFDRQTWPDVQSNNHRYDPLIQQADQRAERALTELRSRFPNSRFLSPAMLPERIARMRQPLGALANEALREAKKPPVGVAMAEAITVRDPIEEAARKSRSAKLPQSPAPPRPSSLNPASPAAGSPDEMLLKTLDRARLDAQLEKNPRLIGVDHGEWLVEPEASADALTRNLNDRTAVNIQEVLSGETESVRSEVESSVKRAAENHIPEAAKAVIEKGKAEFNRQPKELKQKVSRSRFLSEIVESGKPLPEPVKTFWPAEIAGHFFLLLGLWDIAWTFGERGDLAGLEKTAAFVVLWAILKYGATFGRIGAVVSSGLGYGLLILGLIDIWSRLARWYNETLFGPDRELILGDRPWEVRDELGNVIGGKFIGFRTFPNSPGFGLERKNWYLKYETPEQMTEAVLNYFEALHIEFRDFTKVPPGFSPLVNMEIYLDVICTEWALKRTEERDRIQAEWKKLVDEQKQKETNLFYPLSGHPRPRIKGLIHSVTIDPELPKNTDRQVKVKAFFGETGLPGDKLNETLEMELKKNGRTVASESLPAPIEFGLSEAVRVHKAEKALLLSGPGDYELAVRLKIEPGGEEPEPKILRFSLLGDKPAEGNEWYLRAYVSDYDNPRTVKPLGQPGGFSVEATSVTIRALVKYARAGNSFGMPQPMPFTPYVRAQGQGGIVNYGLAVPKPAEAEVTYLILFPLVPGPQEIKVALVSPEGEALLTKKIVVAGNWTWREDDFNEKEAKIEESKRRNRGQANFKDYVAFVGVLTSSNLFDRAAAAIGRIEIDCSEHLARYSSDRAVIPSLRYRLALRRGLLAEALAARQAALAAGPGTPSDRSRAFKDLAEACLRCGGSVSQAWAFWKEAQAADAASGQRPQPWPWVWPVSK